MGWTREPRTMMPLRSLLAILALAVLALLSFVLLERLEKEGRRARKVNLPPIDYLLESVRYSVLDGRGQLRLALTSPRLEHARASDVLTLREPYLVRYQRQNAQDSESDAPAALIPQTARAQGAEVYEQGKRLRMFGAVNVQAQRLNSLPTTLKTEELWFYPDQHRAESKREVEIQQDGTILRGVGLRANFETQTVELLQNVSARYLRPKAP